MLQKAVRHILLHGYHVTFVARDPRKIESVRKDHLGRTDFVALDYHDTNALIKAVAENGPYNGVICWMHSTANASLKALLQYCSEICSGIPFYQIKGSGHIKDERLKTSQDMSGVSYRDILLGFKIEHGASRWLTNDEIAEGVIHAFDTGDRRTIIGQVEPSGLPFY